jgi:hypothetical protein
MEIISLLVPYLMKSIMELIFLSVEASNPGHLLKETKEKNENKMTYT